MIVYIDRLLERFANTSLRQRDHEKHTLPKTENSPEEDFINQEYDLGKTPYPKYPMFPYMTEEEYERKADDLRTSNADGFITYNIRINKKDGSRNARPRIIKFRKIDLPPTEHDDVFYEMVTYSLTDDTVIAYYLCTERRINNEKRAAVYTLDGKPLSYNQELRKELQADHRAWQEVSDYFDRQEENEDDGEEIKESTRQSFNEAYSSVSLLKDRHGGVAAYIKSDPKTGDKILTTNNGGLLGFYIAKRNITTNRFGRLVGYGDLLTTLLQNKLREGVENKNDIESLYNLTNIIFFEKSDGTVPVLDFINETIEENEKLGIKIISDLCKINIAMHTAKPPLSRHLEDGIFELRTKQGNDIARNLYFFIYGDKLVFTNGFIKKTQKTPPEEIKLAKKRRNEFLSH